MANASAQTDSPERMTAGITAVRPSEPGAGPPRTDEVHESILCKALGWERKKIEELPAGTKFNHANKDGVWIGAGQSGHSGEAIWMTSKNDVNAAHGYGGRSGTYFVIEAKEPLKLAVMDEQWVHVEHDELGPWVAMAQKYHVDGVKTEYGSSYEIVLFDRNKITAVAERLLGEQCTVVRSGNEPNLEVIGREMEGATTLPTGDRAASFSRFDGRWPGGISDISPAWAGITAPSQPPTS
ncbi:hypothetical protein [Bradyrhizobium tunisiense]|uniref:hypothetical protein n=1 Tax=Bradyrhizobium tunisiense TaxID=3278709 RepID=UPI0035D5D3BD